MDKEVKDALITASAITTAIVVAVPVALAVYDQGLRPLLEKDKYHPSVKLK